MSTVGTISVDGLRGVQGSGAVHLVDVRSSREFAEVHAIGAKNIPLDRLDPASFSSRTGIATDDTLYVICKMGGRSQKACNQLTAAGFQQVVNVSGGTDAWVSAGHPVIRSGSSSFAVNRQVQIVAGSLVLLGIVLGRVAHPGFLVLSAFIGAGLVFSGVTNTCGMGTVLSMMPWNREPKVVTNAAADPAADCDTGG